MTDTLVMNAKEAIEYAADHFGVPSMYQMAKDLSDDKLTVQAIQIKNYLNGTLMSQKVADRFNETYGIIIGDVYNKSNWAHQNE